MLQHFIIQFSLYYLPSGRLWEVLKNENFKLLAQKAVAVAHERFHCIGSVSTFSWFQLSLTAMQYHTHKQRES